MNKKSKEKMKHIMDQLQNEFYRQMKKVGYTMVGIASYGAAKDLVMVFQDADSDGQYYISCPHMQNAILAHDYANWKRNILREICMDKFGDQYKQKMKELFGYEIEY